MDLALLLLRLTVGLFVAGHGAQKLFGWHGGHGLRETAAWLASIGFRPGLPWALTAGILELGGGLLLALGLFSPIGSLAIAASMLTAIAKVHWPKVWTATGGFELPMINLAVAASVAVAGGPGAISVDGAYGIVMPPGTFAVGGLIVILGWLFALFNSTLASLSALQSGSPPPASHR